jgi:hypothetical protein
MIAAWLVFPAVMLAVCSGCGLLLEAVAGWRLPGPLVPVAGFALAMVAVTFAASSTTTAEAATPLIGVLGVGGFILGRGRLRELRRDGRSVGGWALVVAAVVFLLCAAPVVMSGNATFLGYYILNDSSFHLGLANLVVGHGPRTTDLPQDGYTALVGTYILTDYPTGADALLGALSKLDGAQNVAWNLQPYLAVVLALGAAGLYELLDGVVSSRPLRCACALIAGLNGMIYALYAIASIKELVSITMLTMLACLVVRSVDHLRPRGVIPIVVVTAAVFDALGITAVPWVGVPVAVFVLASLWRTRARISAFTRARSLPALSAPISRTGPAITLAGLALAAVLYPIIRTAPTFFHVSSIVLSSASDTGGGALGYLIAPLSKFQMLGIWPDYDFRFGLPHVHITYFLIGIAVASGVLGGLWLIRTRAWPPLLLLVGNGVSAIYLLHRSTPYAASKVMLIVSVAVVLIVTMGAAALSDARRRIEAWILIATLAAGVLWTDGLTYRYDSVAPSGKLHELAAIDSRYNGQGPVLFPYGDSFANYLLHDLTPSTSYQPGVQPVPVRNYTPFQQFQLRWDTDNINPPFLDSFRLLVADGSPAFSRPPGNWELIDRGRYYNVWRRTSRVTVIEHVGFGTYPYSSQVPRCGVVTRTARTAIRDHARLAYVLGSTTATLIPARQKSLPPGWVPVGGDPDELIPREGPGSINGEITAPRSGSYQVWFDGDFSQKFTVSVDGHQVGSIINQLGPLQQATKIATIQLTAGRHTVTISRPAANSLLPGADDPNPNNRAVGPLMFVNNSPNYTVSTIAPKQAKTLCGKSLDWLEIIR